MKFIRKFLETQNGASLTSYGLTVGLIAVLAISATDNVGSNIEILFSEVDTEMTSVADAASGNGESGEGDGGSSSGEDIYAEALGTCDSNPTPEGRTNCQCLINGMNAELTLEEAGWFNQAVIDEFEGGPALEDSFPPSTLPSGEQTRLFQIFIDETIVCYS